MRKGSILFFIITLLLISTQMVAAPTIVATVNSKKVGLEDLLVVTYSFRGLTGIQSIRVPENFGPFYNIGRQQSMTNDDLDYVITLQPSKTGRYIIPGATAIARGVSYQTNSVTVEVVYGSILKNQRRNKPRNNDAIDEEIARMQQMMRQMMGLDEDFEKDLDRMMRERQRQMEELYNRQRGNSRNIGRLEDNLYIKAKVDKTKVYLGESINISYKIYNRAGFENGSITKLPELKGFYSKDYDIPMPPQGKVELIGNQEYLTFLVKKAQLFPVNAGKLMIDPMEFTAFSNYYGQVKLASDPIAIQVLPIPIADSGIGYTGGIGKFSITHSVDKTQMTTDDVGILKITISGVGNIDLIKSPEVPFPEGLQADAVLSDKNSNANQNELQSKEFTIQFSAMQAGTYTIPSYKFSYFDPEQGRFITTETEPITIQVDKGVLNPTQTKTTALRNLPIKDIDTSSLRPFTTSSELPRKWWYWSGIAMLLSTVPIMMIWRRNRNKIADNHQLYKKMKANKIAQARLRKAQSLIKDEDKRPFYEEISKAMGLYLSDKLDIPLSELNKAEIKNAMTRHTIQSDVIDKTLDIISESEMALYSPANMAQDRERILKSSIDVIEQVENALSDKIVSG